MNDNIEDNEVEETKKAEKMSVSKIMKALSQAVNGGNVSAAQAAQMRTQMGITQAMFTRKQPTQAERKSKRKAQRAARRVTRQFGFKGQRMSKGQRS